MLSDMQASSGCTQSAAGAGSLGCALGPDGTAADKCNGLRCQSIALVLSEWLYENRM